MYRSWSTLAVAALSALALLMLALPAGGQAPQGYAPPTNPGQPQFSNNAPPNTNTRPVPPNAAPPTTPVPPAGLPANAMDVPLQMINEAARSFQAVRDYSCLFVKQEQIKGQLQPENLISMRVRNQPFSVYLKWLAPKTLAGQEVCYVAGKNNGQMRVHSPGVLGIVGFQSIEPGDPRAMATSRHQITDAGIGNLIERFRRNWETERQLNRTQVRIGDYEYNKRPCTRVETIHPEKLAQYPSYRTVIYFDKENRLPIRLESYDWPVAGGPREGALQESYSYVDLRFNVGLTDDNFKY